MQLRRLGHRNYEPVWRDMQAFTAARQPDDPDQLWLVEHPPVYTLGLNGKLDHLLAPGDVPVLRVDRGGQITYHGPGQVVAYLLLDLQRRRLGVRDLVSLIEQSVIDLLRGYDIIAESRRDAPGVYVDGAKIAALGLRVRHGCCYHGLALNVDMDLEPFAGINPCGYAGMQVTQLSALGGPGDLEQVGDTLADHLAARLGYRLQQES
jgi:lipoyl(octanoyl) transferase